MNILSGTFSRAASLLTGCLLLLLLVMPAAAEEAAIDCSSESIKAAFLAAYPGAGSAKNEGIGEIQAGLKKFGYHPGRIDGWYGPDTEKALEQFCLSFKVNERLAQEPEQADETSVEKILALRIGELLKTIASETDEPKEILLSGGGCGCSRDFGDNSLVYGFYPYWLADGENHVIDFSLYQRIGYFALKLDDEGRIEQRLHFPRDASTQPNIAELVKSAHKHRVKVDVTFLASNWKKWDDEQVGKAIDNIYKTVARKYERSAPLWWRKYMPFVENYATVSADGINLYFPEYTESEDGSKLVKIVKELKFKLKQADSNARLNIMLGIDLMDVDSRRLFTDREEKSLNPEQIGERYKALEGQFQKIEKQLQALEEVLDAEPKAVDHVFLFLTQDTSQSKKDLRQVIENAFSGEARRTVLRKIIPIVVAQGLGAQRVADREEAIKKAGEIKAAVQAAEKRDSQFEDDLIYMQDNFAGVGLWHLPLSQDDETAEAEIAKKEAAQEEALKKEEDAIKAAEKDAEAKIAAAEAATVDAEVAKKVAQEADKVSQAAAKKAAEQASDENTKTAKAAVEAAETAKSVQAAAEKEVLVKETIANLAESNVKVLKDKAEKAAADKAEAEKQEPLTDVETIRQALIAKYQPHGEFALLADPIEPYAVMICEYACPNRWVFRIVLDVLLGLALIYALLAMWYCRLREFYRRRLPYFLGFGFVTAVVFAVTAVCDPYLRERAAYALIVILLAIIAYLIWLRRRKTPHLP